MSELADFVLNYYRQAGAIVDPPRYGVYEALLPEGVARQLGVPPYQRLAFDDGHLTRLRGGEEEEITRVGYGHPLVEVLTEAASAEPACARVYINAVRLEKRGLIDLARSTLVFPNARLVTQPQGLERRALTHYVRFNFKAALITDEKREQLVSVVMDAQAGWATPDLIEVERLTTLEDEPAFAHLPPASLRWQPHGSAPEETKPSGELMPSLLESLLPRAARAALDELATPLASLQRRAARYLELDHARLTQYYDDIANDLERRIQRASDRDRRDALEGKLSSARAEREAKLADVEAKHRLRVELQLINLLVIVQPKLFLPLCIENRTAQVTRMAVWDPLLQRIEPLVCDVCGRAATRLILCSSGHLAHEDCLLPQQCVDCKRVYCQLCHAQMVACAVCERPVCTRSLNRCQTCDRGTCSEHVGLCHAADGQPARLPAPEPLPSRDREDRPVSAPREEPPAKPTTPPKPPTPPERKPSRPAVEKPQAVTGYRLAVQVEPDTPVVTAFVLTKGWKNIAVRSWELVENGIAVACHCEKGWGCRANNVLLLPEEAASIQAQIEAEIEALRAEYRVPSRRVSFTFDNRGTARSMSRLVLSGQWQDESTLAAARIGFDET